MTMQLTPAMLKAMYQNDLPSFIQLAFKALNPTQTYQQHWSTEVLGHALQQCHEGKIRRLIINLPPRSLKSFCASVAFPAWLLGRRPEAKVMCIAGHRGLADDQHALSHRLMTHPKYRAVFPHVEVEETTRCLRLPHGGLRSAFAATPSSGITGRGADFIIIDDPLNAADADNPDAIAAANDWYDRNIYQRLDDKHQGVIILVMQRLSHDDLTGHVLQQGDWHHINLASIATEDEYTSTHGLPGKSRLLRSKGMTLHPNRENILQLYEVMLNIGARPFMAQYQQNPYPPGRGEGHSGSHFWLEPMGEQWPGVGEVKCLLAYVPQEQLLAAELFGQEHPLPQGTPGLRWPTGKETHEKCCYPNKPICVDHNGNEIPWEQVKDW